MTEEREEVYFGSNLWYVINEWPPSWKKVWGWHVKMPLTLILELSSNFLNGTRILIFRFPKIILFVGVAISSNYDFTTEQKKTN